MPCSARAPAAPSSARRPRSIVTCLTICTPIDELRNESLGVPTIHNAKSANKWLPGIGARTELIPLLSPSRRGWLVPGNLQMRMTPIAPHVVLAHVGDRCCRIHLFGLQGCDQRVLRVDRHA